MNRVRYLAATIKRGYLKQRIDPGQNAAASPISAKKKYFACRASVFSVIIDILIFLVSH
jgi:hypothetical protein